MPALPAVAKVLRFLVHQHETSADQNMLNRFYYNYTGAAPANADLVTLATNTAAAWLANMTPLQPTTTELVEIDIEDLSTSTAAVGAWVGSHFGTRAGTGMPNGVAACLSEKIARRYRGGHPRLYLKAGVMADLQTDNTWTAAFITAVNAGFTAFDGAIEAAVWAGGGVLDLVNVSYYHGQVPFLEPSGRYRNIPTLRGVPLVDPITSAALNPHIASQRRRNQQGV